MATMTDYLDYTTRRDPDTTVGYTYIGEAMPGSVVSEASWRISKINNATGAVVYAGNGGFSHKWTDRASLAYA